MEVSESRRLLCGVAFAAFLLLPIGTIRAANIAVNISKTYQTVDGLGSFSEIPDVKHKAGIFWTTRNEPYRFDQYCYDFGASMVRYELAPTFWPAQDGAYNLYGTVYGTSTIMNQFTWSKEFVKRGLNRFFFTVWSPPCWMKSNYAGQAVCGDRDAYNGGNFNTANTADYVKMLVDFCKIFKDSVGVEIYGLSPANEPMFANVGMNACVWTGDQLNTVVTDLAAALKAAGLSTRVVGPEMLFGNYNASVATEIGSNPDLYAFGWHYGSNWSLIEGLGPGKQLWDTEDNPTGDLMSQAQMLYNAFIGGMSGYEFWGYTEQLGTEDTSMQANQVVLTGWTPTPNFYGASHFFRYVKGGAVRVDCSSDNGALNVVAFKNVDSTVSVVIINNGGATTADLTGTGLPAQFNKYESAGSEMCQFVGQVTTTGIAIAASSVTTLYSGPNVALPVDTSQAVVASPDIVLNQGELNVYGDDTVAVYLNGQPVLVPTATYTTYLPLVAGDNVLACKLRNDAWGGCLIASVLLPGGDTLRTDSTWKLVIRDPGTTSWTSVSYDDSKWGVSGQIGPANVWPGFANVSFGLADAWAAKASWIYGPRICYFRREISGSYPSAQFRIGGGNYDYAIYLNGTLVKQGTDFASCQSGDCGQSVTVNVPISGSGCVGIAVTDASYNGSGAIFSGTIALGGGANPIKVDSSWQCSFVVDSGWNQVGYNASSWGNPGAIIAGGGSSTYEYPRDYWFRKKFTLTTGSARLLLTHSALGIGKIVKTEYFTLQGVKIQAPLRKGMTPGSVVLQRSVLDNGKVICGKILVAQ